VQNARQEEALAIYEKTVLMAFEEVENGLVLYAKEQIRRRSLQDAVTSSQKSLETANKLYANGLTDFLRVLDAERSVYQAQDALVQSDRTISANLISLYKSLGGDGNCSSSRLRSHKMVRQQNNLLTLTHVYLARDVGRADGFIRPGLAQSASKEP